MEIHTIESSANGKRNAFHHHCDVVGHFRPYATCLHLCKERKEGRLNPIYADCSAAIGKKRCPALSMRAEEKEIGRAIYFVERMRNLGESFISMAKELVMGSTPSSTSTVKSTPSTKSSVIDKIDTGTYADAINAAMKKDEAAAPVTEIKIEAKKGESPLELAKRLLSMKTGDSQ